MLTIIQSRWLLAGKSDSTGPLNRYVDALVRGEQALAHTVIANARKQGIGAARIYLEVLAPSQDRIGELWHEGALNIAQEHLATSITMAVMDTLREEMRPRRLLGARAVVTPVEGDEHVIGARMVADFLSMDGWEVDFLGKGTPAKDLVEFVRQRDADIVALSCTLPEFLPNAREATAALGELDPAPKVLLGGLAVDPEELDVPSLGGDAFGRDARHAVDQARSLVGLERPRLSLTDHLAAMGRKINSIRTALKMTQQDLAEASGLDRTYISMVERGRQNLTMGAVVKIADALNVPVAELVSTEDG